MAATKAGTLRANPSGGSQPDTEQAPYEPTPQAEASLTLTAPYRARKD